MKRDACFQVVTDFEAALCEYTGAEYAVTTDSCTNAIYLCLQWLRTPLPEAGSRFERQFNPNRVSLPRHTYVGVAQAARNAGYEVKFADVEWKQSYRIEPFRQPELWDAAKHFERNMYWQDTLTCLSFQAGKHLPIGRGGAILTDNADAADWLRRARLDGRTGGADYAENTYQGFGAHCYLDPPSAARGLWLLTYLDDDDKCDWTEYPDLSEATWT